MVKVSSPLILWFFSAYCYGATVYHSVDKKGAHNVIDDDERIPSAYRNQFQIHTVEDAARMEPPILLSTSMTTLQEEEKKDIYGSGEERWKEKEHP